MKKNENFPLKKNLSYNKIRFRIHKSIRKDNLLGLKENVILGQLIPAGTGFNREKVLATVNEVEEDFEETI